MLAGELAAGDVALKPASWYAQNGITLCTGQPVTALDPVGPCRRSARRRPAYRSTSAFWPPGSEPIRLPLPGSDLAGVVTTSALQDARILMSAAEAKGLPAVVIGGGLLGIEAAYGLVARRSQGDTGPSGGPADGAPARCRGRRPSRAGAGGQRHPRPARHNHAQDPRRACVSGSRARRTDATIDCSLRRHGSRCEAIDGGWPSVRWPDDRSRHPRR